MAKKIQGDDIIEDDHLANAIKSGKDLLEVYKKIDAQIVKTAKSMKKVTSTKGGQSAKGIQNLNKALSESTKQKQAAITVDKQKATLEAKLKVLNSDRIQQNVELKVQLAEQAKVNKQLAREKLGLVGAYEKESKLLIKLRKQLKDLVITEGEGSKKTKDLAKQVAKLDTKLKAADATAGQFQRNVGNYPKGLKGAIGSLKQFAGALGLVGGIQLFTKVISSSFNTIKDFGQSIANLSAITGATGEDLEFFKQKAIEMGKSTTLSASQVAEGFKIIASAKPELLEDAAALALVTEKSILLAEAAGIELPEAAAAVTNALNQFGAGAEKTSEFVDVLAAGAKFGAGDINFLNEALIKAGTVASNANFSFSATASALELLAEKGMPASIAGTNLKGVILQLQKAGVGFVSGQFDFNDALEETRVMLDGISDPAERAAKEIKLFGSQNLAAGQTFLNGADRLAELNKNLGETGTAAEQAAVNNDTLEGSLKLLASAWEGYILGADGAGGITEKLKGIVTFLADNLETIFSVLGTVIKVFVTYKVVTFAVTKAVKLYRIAQDLATKGLKKFTAASKLNTFGAIAAALVLLLPLILGFIDGLLNAENASNLLERVTEKTNQRLDEEKIALEKVGAALNETTAGSIERQKIIDETNEKYGTTLENLEDETEFVLALGEAYGLLVDQLEARFQAEVEREFLKDLIREREEITLEIARLTRLGEKGELGVGGIFGGGDGIADLVEAKDTLEDVNDQIDILKNKIGGRISEETEDGIVLGCTDPAASNFNPSATQDDGSCVFTPTPKDGTGKGKKKKFLDVSDVDPNEGILDEDKKADFEAFKRGLQQNTREIELELRKRGVAEEDIREVLKQRELEDLQLLRDAALEIHGGSSQEFLDLDLLVRQEISKRNKEDKDALQAARDKDKKDQEKADKKRLDDLKKMRNESLKIIKQISKDLAAEIDKRIDKRRESISEKQTEVQRLQALAAQGNTDAAEAIKAEKIAIAKEKIEIERLEKRKKNLLISVAGLERVSQLIGSGNGNPFATAGSEMKDFLGKIKNLSEGTDYNIGQTLGAAQRTGTDGHLAWVDKDEKLLSIRNSKKLKGMHQDEVTRRALAYNNDLVNGSAINVTALKQMTDTNIVAALQNNTDAIKKIRIVQQHIDLNTGKETIRDGNKTTNIDHRPKTFKI